METILMFVPLHWIPLPLTSAAIFRLFLISCHGNWSLKMNMWPGMTKSSNASCSVLHVLHLVKCLQIKWWNFTIYEFITVTVQMCRSWGGGWGGVRGAVAPHENIGVANMYCFCPPHPIILTKYWGGKHRFAPHPPPPIILTTWKIPNARIGLKSTVKCKALQIH